MPYENLTSIASSSSLADAAYVQLSEAILRNELPAGTTLSVPELARRLSISRSPVREAVLRLVHEGLAEYHGRRGTYVSSIQVEDFLALLDVREVLEGLAARRATENAGPDELRAVASLSERLLSLEPGTSREAEFVEVDVELHRLVREIARNEELTTLLGRTQARAHLSMHSLWRGARHVEAVIREHSEILAAILAGDPDRAEQAARTHIRELKRRVAEVVEDQPGNELNPTRIADKAV